MATRVEVREDTVTMVFIAMVHSSHRLHGRQIFQLQLP